MKPFKWSEEKNELLKKHRWISFEMLITKTPILYIPKHNPEKYPSQDAYIFEIGNYPYFVPFVEEEDYIFLKNCIPERKFKYLLDGKQ